MPDSDTLEPVAGIFEPAPEPPLLLQRRGTDEFHPAPDSHEQRRARAVVDGIAPDAARRAALPLAHYLSGRLGTAASLMALNAAWEGSGDGEGAFYDVAPEAAHDPVAAEDSLGGAELVVDVQTHYVAQERATAPAAAAILAFIRQVAPERWASLPGAAALSMAEFLRCVYLQSETAVAVLTSAPGEGEHNILTNAEIAGTRELLERLGGDGRLLHHAIVHPNLAGELEAMEALRDRYQPVGWKVYTLYANREGAGWRLDDEASGIPFLQRSRELGVRRVCAHKGLSQLAPTGSPDDVGPAAAAFPDLDFLIYHSGYEVPVGDLEEGPYQASAAPAGTDRLVASLLRSGVGPGANVYAELGSTWYLLARRPREAAHVLGKLLRAVGEDNVLWGTDSVWYGSPQPLIDAFRAFRIPASYCDRYGYPALTPRVKEKILGLNAARVYGIDPARARRVARSDDLAWVRAALDETRTTGTPRWVGE